MSDDAQIASVGILLDNLDQEFRRLFRKLYQKDTNQKFGVLFNQTCLNENLLPFSIIP